MTLLVRSSYRKHRGVTWGLGIALVLAIAVIASPIASGASEKTFKLALSSPACVGGSTTVTVSNTAKTQTLGSVQIYFPANSVASSTRGTVVGSATSPYYSGTRDIITIDNLNLAKGSSSSFVVTFKAGSHSGEVSATGKQSNTFNDTQGGANLFERDPDFAWPQLAMVTCGTVQGRVYHDRNADSIFTFGTGAFDDADVPKAWTVEVYTKTAGSYPSTPSTTTTSSATTGAYSLSLPFGQDYKLCVKAAGADASSPWGVQSPTGSVACGPVSPSSAPPATSPGYELTSLALNQANKDFVVVPVTGILFGAGDTSTVGGYTVDGASNSTKPDARYTQETWVDEDGNTNFRFAPVTPCALPLNCTQKLYLLETLTAEVAMASIDGQISLRYDDVAPFTDAGLRPMPYCLIDPRQSGGALATSGVIPPGASPPHTSCIVEGSQLVIAGSKVRATYRVYTAIDGGRQIG